jgi:glucokinase
MFLGIEIGGTKLQLGVGPGDGTPLAALERLDVEPRYGAKRIRQQLAEAGKTLIERHGITAVGVGFGGPVDATAGRTIISHQVDGWEDFCLADWCRQTLGLPTVVANDSDLAGLAEARFGAGRGHRVVFYTNIGSGIGGALVIDGRLYRGGTGVASELGHLRPGLECDHFRQTVESIASGFAIAAAAQQRLLRPRETDEEAAADLLRRCDEDLDKVTAALVAEAAVEGNLLAWELFDSACQTFGWAVAQTITLLAPNVVVIGGGVSLVGERLLLAPLREYVARYVFPPLQGTFEIVPAKLGEEVVVYGALAMASEQWPLVGA